MKEYKIYLAKDFLGTSQLEKADPPIGVVFGAIEFSSTEYKYDYFKSYCLKNEIRIANDYPSEKLIATTTIQSLKVINEQGEEIKGVGNQISGMDGEGYEIFLEGIDRALYKKEFPHHMEAYKSRF